MSDRHLSDVLGRVRAAKTPPEMRSWLLRAVAEKRPAAPPEMDVSWLQASPILSTAGFRGAATLDRLVGCEFGQGAKLRAQVHVEDDGRACAVTGRVVGPDGAPLAASTVEFFVDRSPCASATTDARGEFSFDERPGTTFGVRVGEGRAAAHVMLLDLSRRGNEGRAAR
jgi:hypothetical protein